jgi:multidrug efflux pump subunit AcrA (membrane-fusion protein)
MKTVYSIALIFSVIVSPVLAAEGVDRVANTVLLNETGVKNLRIKTEVVEETTFEESIFALGRINVYPGRRAAISSRIPGRALEVFVKHDHPITKGDVALVVESRQPGNPPPRVEVTAPISGLVSATHIIPGEPVDPDKVLAEILDLSEVYALASVPEHLAGQLRKGQRARITVPAVPDRVFDADLEHFGAMADAQTGTVEAAFHVNNPDLVLRPGMRAEFSIVVDETADVFSIPRAALQGDGANRFVYVKDFDIPNAFVKTPVVVGRINDLSVEILSGLFPADEVVTHGAYSLAFAGGGTLSLKEALDAAHGHEHAADGSELTAADEKVATETAREVKQSPFWMIVSGILFVILLVVAIRKKGGNHVE